MKNASRQAALIAATAVAIPAYLSAAETGLPVELNAKMVECSASKVTLQFTLRNIGSKGLTFSTVELPWGRRESLLLVAVTNDMDASILRPALPVSDLFGGGRVEVAPASKTQGTVDLVERFPDLQTVRSKREVIVFWAYQAETAAEDGPTRQFGGFVLLPSLAQRPKLNCAEP